jgi:hypothetical protein
MPIDLCGRCRRDPLFIAPSTERICALETMGQNAELLRQQRWTLSVTEGTRPVLLGNYLATTWVMRCAGPSASRSVPLNPTMPNCVLPVSSSLLFSSLATAFSETLCPRCASWREFELKTYSAVLMETISRIARLRPPPDFRNDKFW